MCLLRTLFWAFALMLALALAPDFGVLGPASERGREKAGVQDLFYIVSETASDLGEICTRRPDVCERMARIIEQFRNRAVHLAGDAEEWLVGQQDGDTAPSRADRPRRREPSPKAERAGDGRWHLAETPPEKGK
jgi:hypothetical protein